MNIAILGFGTVGSGVYKIIQNAKRQAQNLHVKHILIRKNKKPDLPEMTDSIDEILNDQDVDVVVEVIGGIEPAHQYIVDALKHHKHVITANKAVIAQYIDEFTKVAAENNAKFYFESSVGGGIPWIQGLERALRVDDVTKIQGIFNGTSNFILAQMHRTGKSFNEVLMEAQQLGYAEADPSADIDGLDVANKLCISVDIAYDLFIKPTAELPVFGIRNITEDDMTHFDKLGLTIKLMGKSHQRGDRFDYMVEPTLYYGDALEAHTRDNYNLISLIGETIGTLKFMGQGAGQLPTANAVIQDILDIFQDKEHLKREFKSSFKFDPNLTMHDYIVRSEIDCSQLFGEYQPELRGDYLLIHDIPVGEMHSLMRQVLKRDETAFMASLPSKKGGAVK
ncbi:homoserine dehydrogenase [Lentilactobacillus parabuchneri]|uniref:homoserine dehydrogenase n=1 Tax=Lentilactobacillus parabuchneri TaxID=152331 RepID=UPI00178CE784|nr:homoserine dehydrogenase [Lentilactobacillus parabuchneri]QOJ85984.1 homoserine dehydrogenase [Lentilactobacillus parabuchneri]